MKSLFKVAGIILAALFAVSMFASATASASGIVWEQCTKGPVNSLPTKYSENGCSTLAQTTGEWQWQEVNGTEKAKTTGSLLLKDTKTIAGVSEVECYGESEGVVGPKSLDKTTKITVISCRGIKVCEKAGVTAEAVDLPWQTELFETEGKKLDLLTEDGNGKPGWSVKCKVAGLAKTDTCKAEGPESLLLENKPTGSVLLVLATFQHLRKAECTEGGVASGEVIGSIANLQANGAGLKVS